MAYLGLITRIPRYFCKSCLKACREEADLIGDGREFQRRVLVKSGEMVPGRRAALGMQSERVNRERVVLCVQFEGDSHYFFSFSSLFLFHMFDVIIFI